MESITIDLADQRYQYRDFTKHGELNEGHKTNQSVYSPLITKMKKWAFTKLLIVSMKLEFLFGTRSIYSYQEAVAKTRKDLR